MSRNISYRNKNIDFEISLRLDKLLEFKKYFFSIPNLPLLLIVDPVIWNNFYDISIFITSNSFITQQSKLKQFFSKQILSSSFPPIFLTKYIRFLSLSPRIFYYPSHTSA